MTPNHLSNGAALWFAAGIFSLAIFACVVAPASNSVNSAQVETSLVGP
jgi:hypothetical protein